MKIVVCIKQVPNTADENCPMMKIADLGIVGDLNVIAPKLTEAIRSYKMQQTI